MTTIPVSATQRATRPDPGPVMTGRPPRVLVTGAAGAVATALARDLGTDHALVALDVDPVREPEHWAEAHKVSVGDRDAVLALMADADFALHLAHGAYAGWEGLREVDIDGTRNILDGALAGRCRRVILASSNHFGGWSELDNLAGRPAPLPVTPSDPPRPDGLYGVAKATMEAMGRAAAECFALPVSVLRVGTCRAEDDVEKAVREPGFSYLGDLDAVRRRLSQTWLSHPDLFRIVREELAASETFRLRYAISSTDDVLWSVAPMTWTAPPPASAGG
ncbi:MAG: uronate dehydrogenase [Actinomycetota bacterium]|nr:uronate dehydrogenase [Actinomycetota bacterium]